MDLTRSKVFPQGICFNLIIMYPKFVRFPNLYNSKCSFNFGETMEFDIFRTKILTILLVYKLTQESFEI